MTIEQAFTQIIKKPKWYAGILNSKGTFYNAQTANSLKRRFAKGEVSTYLLICILREHGFQVVVLDNLEAQVSDVRSGVGRPDPVGV